MKQNFKHYGCKFAGVLAVGAVSSLVPAFAAQPDNIVSMVTYFPVPYAAYNNVFVKNKFDIGTNTGNFTLNLGSAAMGEGKYSFQAPVVNLRKGTTGSTGSTWKMKSTLYTEHAHFGKAKTGDNNDNKGNISINIDNLRVDNSFGDETTAVKNITADKVEVNGNMYMFPETISSSNLPPCNEEGNNKVSWQSLTFGGNTKYFLECGAENAGCYQTSMCTSAPSTAPDGWVKGSWDTNNCQCTCSGHSKSVKDAQGNEYCQAYCYSFTEQQNACNALYGETTHWHWPSDSPNYNGETNSADSCYCKCANVEKATIDACTSTSNASWDDENCRCNCPDGWGLSDGICYQYKRETTESISPFTCEQDLTNSDVCSTLTLPSGCSGSVTPPSTSQGLCQTGSCNAGTGEYTCWGAPNHPESLGGGQWQCKYIKVNCYLDTSH